MIAAVEDENRVSFSILPPVSSVVATRVILLLTFRSTLTLAIPLPVPLAFPPPPPLPLSQQLDAVARGPSGPR
ncbi:hypothetical protein CMUS01_04399 [Colletotrichum musicola]|uniref:Uncharacterized protein n=1 Tax=Colletotrichum musicola TaxID=2175873 RepID=A0A8H6KWT1_9PEZI|nr:hypothetical protein CMUS01_04399 [Colletotrichum musicola]